MEALGLSDTVSFEGFVDEAAKRGILEAAWVVAPEMSASAPAVASPSGAQPFNGKRPGFGGVTIVPLGRSPSARSAPSA